MTGDWHNLRTCGMKLRRLVELGVLKTLMHSFLAAAVVVVPKDISARICGDHKMTVY